MMALIVKILSRPPDSEYTNLIIDFEKLIKITNNLEKLELLKKDHLSKGKGKSVLLNLTKKFIEIQHI